MSSPLTTVIPGRRCALIVELSYSGEARVYPAEIRGGGLVRVDELPREEVAPVLANALDRAVLPMVVDYLIEHGLLDPEALRRVAEERPHPALLEVVKAARRAGIVGDDDARAIIERVAQAVARRATEEARTELERRRREAEKRALAARRVFEATRRVLELCRLLRTSARTRPPHDVLALVPAFERVCTEYGYEAGPDGYVLKCASFSRLPTRKLIRLDTSEEVTSVTVYAHPSNQVLRALGARYDPATRMLVLEINEYNAQRVLEEVSRHLAALKDIV